ncbi:slowpoke-binding protein isoform X2 [Zootermopsis nevadensis]|uniref:slowpoke-binding protein isoform X2 n=1 Tax=Zootermopsis nevadensis TaxID=136037 RepID=UPI000B8E5EF1|nr:slowpoke-binding protein isoform X2 [Zootermopsis nevadensis]
MIEPPTLTSQTGPVYNSRCPGFECGHFPRRDLHRPLRKQISVTVDGGIKSKRRIKRSVSFYLSWINVFPCLCKSGNVISDASCDIDNGHGGRYEYTALEADSTVHERMELERKSRERAQNACQHYLRSCSRYALLHHLNDIGSRVDKHWFVVNDTSMKTERLLTLVPLSPNCAIECNANTRSTILELFLALQHPYIYPVLDLDFRDVSGQTYVILVLPFNNRGSLKDLIYKSRWQDDWSQKYGQRSAGLPVSQVQRLGRQILEALVFLKNRGFPPCSHLHSGNIILQNGVARLAGLENTLLGHTSRVHPIIWSRAKNEPPSVDTICFGHVLFEMCAGYELCTPQPSQGHLLDLKNYPQVVEVLDFIFRHPERRFPSVEELLLCDFFRNIDLREMRAAPLPQAFQTRLTTSTMSLLNEVKQHQNESRGRRTNSVSSATEDVSPNMKERRNNCSGGEDDAGSNDGAWRPDDDSTEDKTTEFQQSPTLPDVWWLSAPQEHRDLSLHVQDDNPISMETRRLLRFDVKWVISNRLTVQS